MTMAHVLAAWLNLPGTEPSGTAVAAQALAGAHGLGANEREQGHLTGRATRVETPTSGAPRAAMARAVAWSRGAKGPFAGQNGSAVIWQALGSSAPMQRRACERKATS
jgi:hypothetical protein